MSPPFAETPLRVLPVPSAHRYVAHVSSPEPDPTVVVLPDPPVPGGAPGQWWPPPALEPEVLGRTAGRVDVVHLHFGFESRTVAQLREWVAAAADLDLPWVLTVHDLTNPHLRDQRHHRAQLDVLVPQADEVLTLTPGAATEIGRRWRRRALVAPHPHMLDLRRVGERPVRVGPPVGRPLRVGVHLKGLRASTDPRVVAALETVCREPDLADPSDLDVVVLVHEEVRDPAFVRHDPAVVAALDAVQERGRVRVVWTERLDDAALHAHLASLDVSVLPYRWGTHSGWLEECHDLGTHVLAPRVGHFLEQGPAIGYDTGVDGPDPVSLAAAIRSVRDRPPRLPGRPARLLQRRRVAALHREVWTRVAARPAGQAGAG